MRINPQNSQRFFEIDFLKGLSALLVILIHVLDQYRTIDYVRNLWDILHFAVPAFVISSGFLQEARPLIIHNLKDIFEFLIKRFIRLVRPYYIYVIIHALLILIFPFIFTRVDIEWSFSFLIETITLYGGFSQNWIPRLFVLLMFLYIVFELFRQKSNLRVNTLKVFMLASLSLSTLFLFDILVPEPSLSKYVQTVTWFSFFLYGMILFSLKNSKQFLLYSFFISGIVTIFLALVQLAQGGNARFFPHEYPPTIYFISFSIFVSLTLLVIARKFETLMHNESPISLFIQFLSRHSYTIFFAHYIVMDAIKKPTNFWLTDYFIITSLTILIVFIVNKLITFIRKPWIT